MPVFDYTAILAADSSTQSGIIVADTPREARERLRDQGYAVQSLQQTKSGSEKNGSPSFWQLITQKTIRTQTTTVLRELATLLGAGIPLLTALDTLCQEQQSSRLKKILLSAKDMIASGASLAEAMTACNRIEPGIFDDLSVNLVETGEHTGTLDLALARLADFREQAEQFQDRVKNALMYPIMVAVMGLGVCLFLMTFVVPKLVGVIEETGQDLPQITILVKSISDFLIQFWPWLIGAATLLMIGFSLWRQRAQGKRQLDHLLFSLPLIGVMNRKQSISRITLVLATLLESGIVFTEALTIARKTTGNSLMQNALKQCHDAITTGQNVHEALDQTGLFPPSVVQVFAVGKESGTLEPMLKKLSSDYDQQVQNMAGRLTALLQPIMIILLAMLVGMVALATILPIMRAGQIL